MKKLMILAVVAVCAVMAQAAQFEWTASNVREGWDDSSVRATGTAYLFLVGANGASESAVASAISGAKDASALATTLAGMAIDTQAVSSGAITGTTSEGIAATAPASLFFAVISDDGHAYQSAATTVTTIEALGGTTVAFGSQKSTSSASGAWTTVAPEPTSGLLMLVGFGALALRRRKA